jgi:hypothetical protein
LHVALAKKLRYGGRPHVPVEEAVHSIKVDEMQKRTPAPQQQYPNFDHLAGAARGVPLAWPGRRIRSISFIDMMRCAMSRAAIW